MSESSLQYWADEAARALYAHGARRVWAFGSFGEDFPVDWNSDVDLAVEGLPSVLVARIGAEVDARSPHKIDVMVLEDVTAQVRWFVRRGRLVTAGDSSSWRSNGSRSTLKELRLQAVHDAIRGSGARTVLDLGCGQGWLMERLAADTEIEYVLGVDCDDEVLAGASGRMPPPHRNRIGFEHTLFTWRCPAFTGYDAAVALEVIEHLEPAQLDAFADVLFDFARPPIAVLTTPNVEYNQLFGLENGEYRLAEHKFEWTRSEFEAWSRDVAERYGYVFEVTPVGPEHLVRGAPTQLARFRLADVRRRSYRRQALSMASSRSDKSTPEPQSKDWHPRI